MKLRILYQDPFIAVVDKPAGFHVHPPQDGHYIHPRWSCVHTLRKQLDREVHPIHRLDRATSGVLLFSFTSEHARILKEGWAADAHKRYLCLVRGWLPEGEIDRPLSAPNGTEKPALTRFSVINAREFSIPNKHHPTSRYSLVWAEPKTGRWHQIRRHLAGSSHPIIGDKSHGDSSHNRIFRETLGLPHMYLRAHSLSIVHPKTGDRMTFRAPFTGPWHALFDWFGTCPLDSCIRTRSKSRRPTASSPER